MPNVNTVSGNQVRVHKQKGISLPAVEIIPSTAKQIFFLKIVFIPRSKICSLSLISKYTTPHWEKPTDCRWYMALEERFLLASSGTILRATPPCKRLSFLSPPPAHKFPHHRKRELSNSNISNTQCSSHSRKNTVLSIFRDQLTYVPLHRWELTIIHWVRLRGNIEGDRQT